jgi:MFS family permease
VFYINLPIGILAVVTIFVGLRGEKKRANKAVIDYAGIITLSSGTVSLLLGLNLGGTEYNWLSWQVLGLLMLSLLSWLLFIVIEKKATDPVLSLVLFRNRVFAVTNIVGFLMGLGLFGSVTFLPLFFQGVLGISATSSGNTMLPMMAAMMLTSIMAGRFAARLSFRLLYIGGMTLMAAAFYFLSTMTVHTSQLTAVFYMITLGIGLGIIMPTLTVAAQSAFGRERRGVATSATQFFRSIGGTLGMTVLGAAFNSYSVGIMRRNFFPAMQNIPGITLGSLGAAIQKGQTDPHSLFNILLSPSAINQIPAELRESILWPLKTALADSLQIVFWLAFLFAVFGILVSLLLGSARLTRKSPEQQDAGATLFAEGISSVELAAELVPDIIDGVKSKGRGE